MRNNKFLLVLLIMILLVSVTSCYSTISESQWENAVSKETLSNCMIEQTEASDIDNKFYKTIVKIDNGIIYAREETYYKDEVTISKEAYIYETETGIGIELVYDETKQLWEKYEYDDDLEDVNEFINMINGLKYNEFTYDEQGSYYSMSDNGEEHRLYFSGQKIVKYETVIILFSRVMACEFSSYGEVELTLPSESEISPY